MLSFLLDEHVSPDVAAIVRRSRREIPIVALLDWQDGIWIGESDEQILRAASAQSLTLVTYDQRSIPRLLHRWAALKDTHAGVIFVDERTIAPNDLPELARSLILLWDEHRTLDGRIAWRFYDAARDKEDHGSPHGYGSTLMRWSRGRATRHPTKPRICRKFGAPPFSSRGSLTIQSFHWALTP
jgi:hypothetical protein